MVQSQMIQDIINRQEAIALGDASPLPLPRFSTYSVCNLRGGIGKTSLVFNLSYLAGDILAVDTCPQGNLSYFYDSGYYGGNPVTTYGMLLPHFVAGLGSTGSASRYSGATNPFFHGRRCFFISSSSDLYFLPSLMGTSLAQAASLPHPANLQAIDSRLFALHREIERELKQTQLSKCLIDTSPFFSGATHLSWHAADALIIPVRTDQQSVNSLELLIHTLNDAGSEFRRIMPANLHTPKIQMVALTHCGWSTARGARNAPNKQTLVYLQKIYDIVSRNIGSFTTQDPRNHIVLLDDFLGSGRISSALSKPIMELQPGESHSINRVRVEVNEAVNKVKEQLTFIDASIW